MSLSAPADRDPSAPLDLHDGARVRRACERWPLLELVRRVGTTRLTAAKAVSPQSPVAASGASWWES